MVSDGVTPAGAQTGVRQILSCSDRLPLMCWLGVYLFGGGIWADYGVLVKSNGEVEHGFDLKNDTKFC